MYKFYFYSVCFKIKDDVPCLLLLFPNLVGSLKLFVNFCHLLIIGPKGDQLLPATSTNLVGIIATFRNIYFSEN